MTQIESQCWASTKDGPEPGTIRCGGRRKKDRQDGLCHNHARSMTQENPPIRANRDAPTLKAIYDEWRKASLDEKRRVRIESVERWPDITASKGQVAQMLQAWYSRNPECDPARQE